MNLAKFQVKPVLRNKWEAIDMGVLFARHWYVPLLLSWFIPAALVLFSLLFFSPSMPWLAGSAVWWLKPLFDRVPLFLLSRYIFTEKVSFTKSKRLVLSLFWLDILPALTWRRLDLMRSFNLAVTVLEKQKAKAYGKRCTLLQRGCGDAATWLTLIMVHLELFLSCSFVVVFLMFIPQGVEIDFWASFSADPLVYERAYYCLYLICASLIAPFYVASGFSLYINRRIELEAWDLEIAFRNCVQLRAERAKQLLVKSGVSLPCILALFVIVSLAGGSRAVIAEVADSAAGVKPSAYLVGVKPESSRYIVPHNSPQEASKEKVLAILQSPPFVIEKAETGWVWKQGQVQEEDEIPEWLIWFVRGLEKIFGVSDLGNLASLIEVLLWSLIVTLLVFMIYRFRHRIQRYWNTLVSSGADEKLFEKPEVIMGLEITHNSLPENISAEARELWLKGEARQALALLYRGSLYRLVYQHELALAEWYTEQECFAFVQGTSEQPIIKYFGQLTHTWQKLAYAHHVPDMEQFESLCRGWSEVFPSV